MRTDIWTDSETSIGYETSLSMALTIIPSSTVFLLFLWLPQNISAQSLLLKHIMNSVRKCNNSAASCNNKARTVFTRRQCRAFTGPRHKAFVNTKIMVFRRRFPCKTINAVFCHHWRQQNSLVKHVCNLEPKLKKLPKVARYFVETSALFCQGTLSVLYIKLSARTTQRT